jgi:PAS domain S-box-containing protein
MARPAFFTRLKESFRAKVFSLFIFFIVVISLSFTIFYIRHESRSYLKQLVNEGELLSSLLAYNAKLAVFAENRDALLVAAEGIITHEHVVSVRVFAADGNLLAERKRGGNTGGAESGPDDDRKNISGLIGKLHSPAFVEKNNGIVFYAPIITETVSPLTESLYFREEPRPAGYHTIGLVRIVLDKSALNRRVTNLVSVGILFLSTFLVMGLACAYLVLRGLTQPLNNLMDGVWALGRGDLSRRIPSETQDEIGKVAVAFNTMAATLERREVEKAQLEEQLRLAQKIEAKEEWERTFDTVPDLVAILDKEHRIVRLNKTMADRLGTTKDAAVGKGYYRLFHGRDADNPSCLHALALKEGRVQEREVYEATLDSYFWVTVSPLRKIDGELIGSVHVARDISERKRAEEEKKNIQAKLIQTNKMTSLGLLVSGMAHEVNNPNNNIKFSAHVLARTWSDMVPVLDKTFQEEGDFVIGGHLYSNVRTTMPQLISGITESSRRIEGIIKNLRDFVRKGSTDTSQKVEINGIVSVSVAILNNQIKTYTRDFALDLAEGMPKVRGNAQQLGQVVINLIMNAVQALPDKRRGVSVVTSFDEETGMAVIKVRDNGCGMPPEVKSRLFEPFFSTKLDSGGTGLGLAISNVIIKDHGGVLDFDSVPGEGTTAIVRLPVISAPYQQKEQL